MESVWLSSRLSGEILKSNEILNHTTGVIADILSSRIEITNIIENMAGVLTSKEAADREKGMVFFTKLLKEMPKNYLTGSQVAFIAKFYIDRLKDNHRVVPTVLEGFLALIEMNNYNMRSSGEFFLVLFREVVCQSHVRQDRYHIYMIIKKLVEKDKDYVTTLGPDFVYGFIAAMDGERDPRNLMFLFGFIPSFVTQIPLRHLVDEMFEVLSCYYPIDFHPAPDDPAAVTRNDLAAELAPCLCAVPEFGDQCLPLLIEKLDSSLKTAKLDSLKLLVLSCKTFEAETYAPFIKTLWVSLKREMSHKMDEELKFEAHTALSALIAKLSTAANMDQTFENFINSIIISMQTAIAESKTVAQFTEATKILRTAANASKESCVIITRAMVPASIAFFELIEITKLKIATMTFLCELYDLATHWEVSSKIQNHLLEIPQLCLTTVSQSEHDLQIAGFKTLVKFESELPCELVVPLVEILVHNIQTSQDKDLLSVSVETIHSIARKYPELIMSLVVKGKCDLENLNKDATALKERLNILSNLASIDDFTKVIVEEMLNIVSSNTSKASKVVEALSESISKTNLYSNQKVSQIESDHGLVDSILTWVLKELESTTNKDSLDHGYALIANTVGSLAADKQCLILYKHGDNVLQKCKISESYFPILECLYTSLHQNVYEPNFPQIMSLSLKTSLLNEDEKIRYKACSLVAHFLNKAELGSNFDVLYALLTDHFSSCSRNAERLCPRIITLYGWITKALVLRGSDTFNFWLQKVIAVLSHPKYAKTGAETIRLIMTDSPEHLNCKFHCRGSFLYKQRMLQDLSALMPTSRSEDTKEYHLLAWAYVLGEVPRSLLNNQVYQVAPLVIEALNYDNKEMLLVMTDILSYYAQGKQVLIANSLQTILPRLINLSKYVKSMDVRIKSLECLFHIANTYPTLLLLPFKQDLLLDLAPSLDDKKRLVRNMAVKARTRWYLIGSPGEPSTS